MSEDEEPDWESPEPDPPSLGPEVPSVDVPEVGSGDAVDSGDGNPEAARLFWRLVLVVDVALLALSLGAMFIYFRGAWERGLTLVGFGVVVSAYGVVRYYRYRAGDDSETGEDREHEAEGDSGSVADDDPKG